MDQFLQAIRDAPMGWSASPPITSPLSDFMFGSPPSFLQIDSADLGRYISAAFRLWVTELRPKWVARWHGCAATHLDNDKEADEDCVLLAELDVPVTPASPGWAVTDGDIPVDEERRPYLMHLRMLQEWLICGLSTPAPKLLKLNGPATVTLKDEQFVICNTTGGVIQLTLPPAAASTGQVVTIKRVNSGPYRVTINTSGGESMDAISTKNLTAQFRYFRVMADGQTWHIIGPS
jgi:hypothetical protein